MRTSHLLALAAPVLTLTLAWSAPRAQAQESLAGVGAASGIGATLGAGATTTISPSRVTSGVNGTSSSSMRGDEEQMGGVPGIPGSGGSASAGATVVRQPPTLAGISGSGSSILNQLVAPTFRPIPGRVKRSARAQAAYSRRISRLSAAQRKKLVMNKYKIPARGYLSYYLPADRYKFAKAWKFVSTETDRFYYTPQAMAGRRFNANRVIGFRTWQEAMLAGYRPDPASKPSPGNQLAYLASLTRDEPLIQTVEYAYAGQISPATLDATYNYVRRVSTYLNTQPSTAPYRRDTINKILTAYLVGDPTLIPHQVGYVAPATVTPGIGPDGSIATMSGSMGSSPMGSGSMSSGSMGSGPRGSSPTGSSR